MGPGKYALCIRERNITWWNCEKWGLTGNEILSQSILSNEPFPKQVSLAIVNDMRLLVSARDNMVSQHFSA